MGLSMNLTKVMPVSIYSSSLTHNLSKMAREVVLANEKNLYQILWYPEQEMTTEQLGDYLDEAFNILLADPIYFGKHNPSNRWGSYNDLIHVVYELRNACWENPDSYYEASR